MASGAIACIIVKEITINPIWEAPMLAVASIPNSRLGAPAKAKGVRPLNTAVTSSNCPRTRSPRIPCQDQGGHKSASTPGHHKIGHPTALPKANRLSEISGSRGLVGHGQATVEEDQHHNDG